MKIGYWPDERMADRAADGRPSLAESRSAARVDNSPATRAKTTVCAATCKGEADHG